MYKRYLYIVLLFLCCMLMTACGVYYDDLGSHYAWLESREIVRITEKSEDEESISYDEIIRKHPNLSTLLVLCIIFNFAA